jgi:hypothetical protein
VSEPNWRFIWALYVCGRCGYEERVFVRVDRRAERPKHACVAREVVPEAVRRRIESLGGV